MERALRVHRDGRPIGVLREARTNKFTLTYDDDAPTDAAVSLRLPVTGDRWPPGATAPWLAGLLPDEDARDVLGSEGEFPPHFDLRVLEATGADLPGDVILTGMDEDPLPDAVPTMGRTIDIEQALGLGEIGVVDVDGSWRRPDPGSPSSHLLRPEDPMLPGSAAAEGFALALAAAFGLPVASAALVNVADHRCLVVERPDRLVDAGGVHRRPRETFAQLCGVDTARHPESLYQEQDGPGFLDIAEAIAECSADARHDLEQLVKLMTVQLVIGAGNTHGATFAMQPRSRRLGAVHQLLPTEFYTEVETEEGVFDIDHRLAMSINDIWKSNGLDHEDLVIEASRWPTLDRASVEKCVSDTTSTAPAVIEEVAPSHPDVPDQLIQVILDRSIEFSRG